MVAFIVSQTISRLVLKIVVMTREQGTLNWEQVLGNFTFRYLCRFFSVHLLINDIKLKCPRFIHLGELEAYPTDPDCDSLKK